MKTIALSFLLAVTSPLAMAAPTPADYMTCDQAVAYYEKYKKIYVIAHGKNIVPIYGMAPISKAPRMSCGGRSSLNYYYVNTTDVERCYIAVFCR